MGPLLTPSDPGGPVGQLAAQLSWLGRAADGGLFVLVGVRRGETRPVGGEGV